MNTIILTTVIWNKALKLFNVCKPPGDDFQEVYGLNEENIYDPTVNPAMSQEMSSGAFRVLHSLIPVQFKYVQ